MAEYKELIKNFDKIKDYMRDFFIYGFKSRNDFACSVEEKDLTQVKNKNSFQKSKRTYDNERRRIESYLSPYMESNYIKHEKQNAILINTSEIDENPLYSAWKAKSFTSNDIMLHFFLLDYLIEHGASTVASISDGILSDYGILFDIQIIRKKLKEYIEIGFLDSKKERKQIFYFLFNFTDLFQQIPDFLDGVKFFQEVAPFGYIGSTILDKYCEHNKIFRFKHEFIVHTLEDQILFDSLTAIHRKQKVIITYRSRHTNQKNKLLGIPLQIFVSTQNGRRYLCIYLERKKRFSCQRLDYICSLELEEEALEFDYLLEKLIKNRSKCWGVTFGDHSRNETLTMTLWINEKTESFVLTRLQREGRGGTVTKLAPNTFQYSCEFFDTNEMLTWIKTFTGRILSLTGSNLFVTTKFYRDMARMQRMYLSKSDSQNLKS